MEKYKNCIRLNNKNEKRDLQKMLHPDKHYLEESLANDLMMQLNNSTCSKNDTFPCIVKFDKDVSDLVQIYNTDFRNDTEMKVSEDALEFFVNPYVADLSSNMGQKSLVEVLGDFFDNLLLYY